MPYNLRIPGHFTERELWAIETLAKLVPPGGVVVEVGSFLGMSSYAWAKSVDPSVTVYCIDAWEKDAEYSQKWRESYQIDYSLENFRSFTEKCPNIVVLQGFSPLDFAEWDKSIDVYCQNLWSKNTIFEQDISFWSQFIKSDGIICGWGYAEECPGVMEEVDKLAQIYGLEAVIVEGIWCLTAGGSAEKLKSVAKIGEINGYQYELKISEPPALLAPGDLIKGKLKNISGRDWSIFLDDLEIVKIGIQVYEESKSEHQEFRRGIGVDKFVDGASVKFEFVLDANQLEQGKIRLVFDVVAEGHYWFEEKGAKSQTINLQMLLRNAGNLIKVANQLKRSGKLTEAIAEYRRAIELNPNFSWAYYNLGDALAKQGHLNEAVAEYRRAIALNSNSALYFHSLGKVLAQKSEISEAVNYYEKSIKIRPDIYQKYQSLAPTIFHNSKKCKICNSTSTHFGKTLVLNKYEVDYFQCSNCGFVQTEHPYWLEEAYVQPIASSDVGYVRRNTICSKATDKIISELFDKDSKFLDYGAGYGLFVRMMRDLGYNFYWSDIYCQNLFAEEYDSDTSGTRSYEMVTSFEVFEHFIDPLEKIEKILKFSSNILFSTQLLPSNNPIPGTWWYYAPHEGQHISIYTRKALSIIADYFHLNLYCNGASLHLITDKELSAQLEENVFSIFSENLF